MTHLTMVHGTVCHFHDALREPRVLAEFQELALGGLVVPLFLLDLLPFLFLCRVCHGHLVLNNRGCKVLFAHWYAASLAAVELLLM